jgi:hypothetical protein
MLAAGSLGGMKKNSPSTSVTVAYGAFLMVAFMIYVLVAEGEFSAILTMSAVMQCLAIALLAMKVVATGSADGISVRALTMDAVAFACRLSSTIFYNGYLPADVTGDWVYQAIEICSLCLALWLLRHVLVEKRQTYNADDDSLPISGMLLGCLVCAMAFHADLDDRPIFDTLWMAGLLIGTVAVMPQLWLISQNGGRAEALTSHYVATMAVSRFLSGLFMWHAREDLTSKPWAALGGINHAPFAILGAHAFHLLLLGDFGYYYIKSVAKQGLCSMEPTILV